MQLRKYWTDQDDTITVAFDEGEPTPSEGDVLYLDGADDEGIRVGRILYNKFGVITYEVLKTGIPGSYDEL